MSKVAFYQTDFKPDYQLFQQKISQLSSQKSRITKKQIDIEKLQHQLELAKEQIQDQGLQFDNSSIFVRYASIQQLAQKKKSASECCVHCGDEMKKSIQCEFCAQLYCKNCCWRKRVIPFGEHPDFRLCCQQCHQKYIKHFNNQEFYKEKGICLAAIDELQRKFDKTKVKYKNKQTEVKQYKEQTRAVKIKQGNLKKALLEEQKRIKQLNEQYQKAVQQKALKLKEQEQRRKDEDKNQQKQRQRQYEEKQFQEQKRTKQMQQQQKRILQSSRLKQEELIKRQAQIKRQKEQLQREKRQLSQSRSKLVEKVQSPKIKQESPTAKNQRESLLKKDEEDKQSKKSQKIISTPQEEAPRRVVFNQELDFDAILNAGEERKKQDDKQELDLDVILKSDQQKKSSKNQELNFYAILKERHQSKQIPRFSTREEKQIPNETNKQSVTLKDVLKQIKENKKTEEKIQQPQKEEEKQQKSQNEKSISQQVSQSPKITMNQIKTMSINDLLSMKIPMNPSQPKRPRKSSHPDINVQAEENSTTTENQKMYQSLLQPCIPQSTFLVGLSLPSQNFKESSQKSQKHRQSIQSVHEQEQDDKEKENNKKALLRKESMISSTNKVSIVNRKPPSYDEEQSTGGAQKCACDIM